jgi:hypothetical protein
MKSKHYPPARVPSALARNGFSGRGESASLFGDKVEAAIVEQLGWKPLVGALAGKQRQGAFDLEAPNGTWVELKAMTVFAREYKVKPTARDIVEKLAHAAKHNRTAATVAAVVDERGRAWLYWREGLGAFRLPSDGMNWEFIGKVKI